MGLKDLEVTSSLQLDSSSNSSDITNTSSSSFAIVTIADTELVSETSLLNHLQVLSHSTTFSDSTISPSIFPTDSDSIIHIGSDDLDGFDFQFIDLDLSGSLTGIGTVDDIDSIVQVNTRYKPVGKKRNPIDTILPPLLNSPCRPPPSIPDLYSTRLTFDLPEFLYGGRLTQARVDSMELNKDGILLPAELNLVHQLLRLRELAIAFDDSERGLLKDEYAEPYIIPVIPHSPWRERPLPLPYAVKDAIVQQLKDRLKSGVYERSSSAYNSRFFIVAKKSSNKYRIVHDLQPLNSVTIRDAGLPPPVEEILDSFIGRETYALLDLMGGYDQRLLAEESRDLTTFQSPIGPLRLTRLPQGATNSVQEYQRVMYLVFADEIPEFMDIYIDDAAVKGPTTDYGGKEIAPGIRRFIYEHLVTTERVMYRMEKAGITFSGEKAVIITSKLDLLGSIVSKDGRKISTSKLNNIESFPVPLSTTDVRSFLGVCTFNRFFIPNFSRISKPLRNLLRRDAVWEWNSIHQDAFDLLKSIVGRDILLRRIDYHPDAGAVVVMIDSSTIAAGGALMQEDADGVRHPIRYESKAFTDVESRYSQPKLELAGIVKILKAFQFLLWGRHFIIEVDALYLVQMINSPDLPNSAMNRWNRFIHNFSFDIQHVPGSRHTLADGLSRRRRTSIDSDPVPLSELLSSPLMVAPITIEFDEHRYAGQILGICKYLSTGRMDVTLAPNEIRSIRRLAPKFFLLNQRLFRRSALHSLEVIQDRDHQLSILCAQHDDLGHRGRDEVYLSLKTRFWWPGMKEDVGGYVRGCLDCQLRKKGEEREAREPGQPSGIFKKFNLDVVHIKTGQFPYLVTLRDDLTGWIEARPLERCDSDSIARFLTDEIIPRYGNFVQATVDGGSEFKKEVITALERYGIKRVQIAPNHPEANGMEERGHIPLVDCLAKVCDVPDDWHLSLPLVLFADRIATRRSTGFSPFQLLYGVDPILPIDLDESTWLLSDWDAINSHSQLLVARVRQLQRKKGDVFRARQKLAISRQRSLIHLESINSHRIRDPLEPGQLVLVQNARLDTLHGGKFLPRWFGPFRVLERLAKGSYKLADLNGVPMKKIYASRRLRRFFSQGRFAPPDSDSTNSNDLTHISDGSLDLDQDSLDISLPTSSVSRFNQLSDVSDSFSPRSHRSSSVDDVSVSTNSSGVFVEEIIRDRFRHGQREYLVRLDALNNVPQWVSASRILNLDVLIDQDDLSDDPLAL